MAALSIQSRPSERDGEAAAKRYVVDTIIGPCEQWEAEDLAEAIMQLRQFSNVGGGAVSLTVFEEDE